MKMWESVAFVHVAILSVMPLVNYCIVLYNWNNGYGKLATYPLARSIFKHLAIYTVEAMNGVGYVTLLLVKGQTMTLIIGLCNKM